MRRRVFYAFLAIGVPLAVFGAVRACCLGPSVNEFRRWISEHPDNVGLVAFKVGSGQDGISLNEDERFPLASTRKVLILGAYAVRVAEGALDPSERVPIADIERWYWAGTDGGAHPHALEELTEEERKNGIRLDDVVRAMIRWSDNAASDYMLERVGGPSAVAAFARSAGMKHQDVLMPLFGEFVAWANEDLSDWSRLGARGRAGRAQEIARTTTVDDLPLQERPRASQREFARTSPGGTPREWARLVAMVHAMRHEDADVDAIVRRHMGWPLRAFASNRERFSVFGAKGGSLAGVLTEAVFIKPMGREPLAAALFLRDLPLDVQTRFARNFVTQEFLVELAEDDAFWSETVALFR